MPIIKHPTKRWKGRIYTKGLSRVRQTVLGQNPNVKYVSRSSDIKTLPNGSLLITGKDWSSLSRPTTGFGTMNPSDSPFFPNHNGVPATGVPNGGRYEDKRDRLLRAEEYLAPTLNGLIGYVRKTYDLSPESATVPAFLTTMSTHDIMMACDQQEKYGDRRTELVVTKFKERFPDVKFAPVAEYYTVSNGSKTEVSMFASTSLTPVVITGIPGVEKALFFRVETPYGNSDVAVDAYFVVPNATEHKAVLKFFDSILAIYKEISHMVREIQVYGRNTNIELDEQTWTTWDEVFLDPDIAKAVRDDLMFFMNNEELFNKVGLPYKRGYLLCGPPGNGKSTICRAIATSMPVAAFMFDFSNKDMGNQDLTSAFQWAAENAPSVFFLEDIDRIYGAEDEKNSSNVTLDHLLNCLDGIATNNGVVVVATANNPEKLDPAILSRPGRFDKVVVVKDPNYDLRYRYLSHLFRFTEATPADIEFLADETENLSMAFLKEVFLVTASRSVISGEKLTRRHMDEALEAIFAQFNGISRKGRRKTGFGA